MNQVANLTVLGNALQGLPLAQRIGFQTYVYAQGVFQAVESGEFDRTQLPSLVGALERLGYTYVELASRFEVSAATIGRWAAGKSLPVESAMEAVQMMALEALGDVVVRELNALPEELRALLDVAWNSQSERPDIAVAESQSSSVAGAVIEVGIGGQAPAAPQSTAPVDMLSEILARLERLESRLDVKGPYAKAQVLGNLGIKGDPKAYPMVDVDPTPYIQIIERQPRVK